MDDSFEGDIIDLRNRVACLETASFFDSSSENQPESGIDGQFDKVVSPEKLAAFSVVWDIDKWEMYYPAGCLLCDGQVPTGIQPGQEDMVQLSSDLTSVGITATWKRNKKTAAITDVVAVITGSLSSGIVVNEQGSGESAYYSVTAYLPIAKIENNSVSQISFGLMSLTSCVGCAANDGNLYVKFGSDSAEKKFSANTPNDSTLNLAKVAETGSYEDLTDTPQIPAAANDGKLFVKFGSDTAVQKFSANTPNDSTLELAKVASTGSYNDLTDTPAVPAAPNDGKLYVKFGSDTAVQKFSANTPNDSTLELAKVASTGSYGDLSGRPASMSGTITVISSIQYDISLFQIQIKTRDINFTTGTISAESEWTMITGGQAVLHVC